MRGNTPRARSNSALFAVVVGGSLLPALALGCEAPYTVDQLLTDLVTVEEGLRGGADADAGAAAATMEVGLGCLDEALPQMIAGRALRSVGAGLVAGGQVDRGKMWLVTAAEVEPYHEFGLEDLPEGHAARGVYADAKLNADQDAVSVEGATFIDGKHYLDGKKVSSVKARPDRLHLYQAHVLGGLQSHIIEGNAFPAELINDPNAVVAAAPTGKEKAGKPPKEPKVPKEPKKKEEKVAKSEPSSSSSGSAAVVARQRPPEKTPLLIGGGLIIGGAVGVYYASTLSRDKFNNASTVADIDKFRQSTNQLVVASWAVLAAGGGTLTYGIILDGGGGLGWAVRF